MKSLAQGALNRRSSALWLAAPSGGTLDRYRTRACPTLATAAQRPLRSSWAGPSSADGMHPALEHARMFRGASPGEVAWARSTHFRWMTAGPSLRRTNCRSRCKVNRLPSCSSRVNSSRPLRAIYAIYTDIGGMRPHVNHGLEHQIGQARTPARAQIRWARVPRARRIPAGDPRPAAWKCRTECAG